MDEQRSVLEAITGTLPAKAQPYAKTYAAVLVTALTVDPRAQKQDESVQPPDAEL